MNKTSHDIIRQRLLVRAGVIKGAKRVIPSLDTLLESQWSPRFETLMRNRLLMGAFRYELFEEKQNDFNYDCAAEAVVRIQRFKDTGNTEHLVDAANMCLIEFEFSNHPNKHFASIDDGEHAKEKEYTA